MTIADAEHSLIQYFNDHDSFDIDKNIRDIIPIQINDDFERGIIISALSNLEKGEFIRKIEHKNSKWWVLCRPLAAYTQKVDLNMGTILALTETINKACDAVKDDKNRVDPLNIRERDIQNLIILLNNVGEPKNE